MMSEFFLVGKTAERPALKPPELGSSGLNNLKVSIQKVTHDTDTVETWNMNVNGV